MADFLFCGENMDFSGVLNLIKKEKVLLLDVNELCPNPLQPRKNFDSEELRSLSQSIKKYGLIQPISVKKLEPLPHPFPKTSAKYEIIAGERRWRASMLAGLTHIPCTVFDTDRSGSAMMALIENQQRCDLSFFEEALAMQTLLVMTDLSQSELAHALSISQSTLSNKIRLLRLSERERLIVAEHNLSERHCRALVRISSESERRPILNAILRDNLSAKQTEALIDNLLSPAAPAPKNQKKKAPKIKGALSDMKPLFNTIDKTVSMLKSTGYNADWTKQEDSDGVTIVLRVRR